MNRSQLIAGSLLLLLVGGVVFFQPRDAGSTARGQGEKCKCLGVMDAFVANDSASWTCRGVPYACRTVGTPVCTYKDADITSVQFSNSSVSVTVENSYTEDIHNLTVQLRQANTTYKQQSVSPLPITRSQTVAFNTTRQPDQIALQIDQCSGIAALWKNQ